MTTRITTRNLAVLAAGALFLAACGSDPLDDDADADNGESDGDQTIVVGSQDYYSSEILAEIYAQALEAEGYDIEREMRIGQREVYMPDVESGAIDLFPEYTGPLLQYWVGETDARLTDEVYDELVEAAPEGVNILDQAPATDQDAYAVTNEFAEEYSLESIADLDNVDQDITLGANSEAENRPNGPDGLMEAYGIEVGFTPIEDSGGPLTVSALQDGDIQMAIIYTGDPSVSDNNLVVLEDTEGLFLASHVVPIASDNVDDDAAAIINDISARISPEVLLDLNAQSVNDESPASSIASEWIESEGIAG